MGRPTTKEQWDAYYEKLELHYEYCEMIKPQPSDYETEAEYMAATSQWRMRVACDAPNKPDYYRANND